jgi:hypothetical protein
VLRADKTSVLVWDEQHTKLVPGATRGFRPETVAQMSHAPGQGVTTIGAQLELTSQPGGGTRVAVHWQPSYPA